MTRTNRKPFSPDALVPRDQTAETAQRSQGTERTLTGPQGPEIPDDVAINPSHLKKRGLDRSKDRIIARYPRERSDLIKAHGYSISSIVTEALDRVYTELVSQTKPRPKR